MPDAPPGPGGGRPRARWDAGHPGARASPSRSGGTRGPRSSGGTPPDDVGPPRPAPRSALRPRSVGSGAPSGPGATVPIPPKPGRGRRDSRSGPGRGGGIGRFRFRGRARDRRAGAEGGLRQVRGARDRGALPGGAVDHPQTPPTPRDLVQDTMLRAYRGIGRFDGRHPRAWLLTIMRNAQINRVRRKRPELLRDPDTAMERLADEQTDDLDPSALVVESGFDAAVERAYEALPREVPVGGGARRHPGLELPGGRRSPRRPHRAP